MTSVYVVSIFEHSSGVLYKSQVFACSESSLHNIKKWLFDEYFDSGYDEWIKSRKRILSAMKSPQAELHGMTMQELMDAKYDIGGGYLGIEKQTLL